MQKLEKLVSLMETISRKIGETFAYVLVIFMCLMVYEVIARYFLKSPTMWVHETCGMLFAAYIAFTGGWVLLEKGHVAVDIIYQYFPKKGKNIANIIVSLIGFSLFLTLLWFGWKFGWKSFLMSERSHTVFGPPMWPVKMMLPVGCFLFLFQLCADVGRAILDLKGKDR